MAIGVYPGSFNPPTIAHLAIARAAVEQCGLERVDLVLSRGALGKDEGDLVAIEHREAVLRAVAATRPWLGVRVTHARLLGEIADGYDVLVLGADKWLQINELHWYGGSVEARDEALAALPRLAAVVRPPHPPDALPADATILVVDEVHLEVSATGARAGRREWMVPEARAFDDRTGAWTRRGT